MWYFKPSTLEDQQQLHARKVLTCSPELRVGGNLLGPQFWGSGLLSGCPRSSWLWG